MIYTAVPCTSKRNLALSSAGTVNGSVFGAAVYDVSEPLLRTI